jgi:hypothetical protein
MLSSRNFEEIDIKLTILYFLESVLLKKKKKFFLNQQGTNGWHM